ncbi:MAG TPA: hypothetical protein VH136_08710 [Trebonia sp.]|nr:hypothetical protein [Trebonia sp.]
MISWTTNTPTSPTRNTRSRKVTQRTCCTLLSDSSAAVTNPRPRIETITAVGAILCPGTRANSETMSALRKAVSAADARTRCSWASVFCRASRSAETEIATNSSPISAPATPPLARKKSWIAAGTTRRSCQAGLVPCYCSAM